MRSALLFLHEKVLPAALLPARHDVPPAPWPHVRPGRDSPWYERHEPQLLPPLSAFAAMLPRYPDISWLDDLVGFCHPLCDIIHTANFSFL